MAVAARKVLSLKTSVVSRRIQHISRDGVRVKGRALEAGTAVSLRAPLVDSALLFEIDCLVTSTNDGVATLQVNGGRTQSDGAPVALARDVRRPARHLRAVRLLLPTPLGPCCDVAEKPASILGHQGC